MRAGQPAECRPLGACSCSRPGGGRRWDVFVQVPAALMIPIGNRFYDWKYESEPEPGLGGRRVYHARGKVLGGSSSINGMIFQRGNPLDFEQWAGDPGMERWDRALPAVLQTDGGLPAPPEDRFHEVPARSSSARPATTSSAPSSTPCSRPATT